jgi:hypothetical protein
VKILAAVLFLALGGLAAGGVAQVIASDDASPVSAVVTPAAEVLDCPSGSVLDTYPSGSRIYAVARTDDGEWIQVRDLSAPDRVVWVRSDHVNLDEAAVE